MKIGNKLKNGALVINFNSKYVLAYCNGAAQPWVIWQYNTEKQGMYWGNYFREFFSAVKQYEKLVNKSIN